MSKRRLVSDTERTQTMLDLVHCCYPSDELRQSYVVIEEVAPGTGYSSVQRYADVLVLAVWPSLGLTLDGYEIKASRADLKKELADLSKHMGVARYCNRWTLLAWDESVLVDGIPDDWGIAITVDGEHGRELKQIRKAPNREPQEWPRAFVCSLVRNAYQQGPRAAFLARAVIETADRARSEWRRVGESQRQDLVLPLTKALFGRDSWKWPAEARNPEHVVKIATERLMQGALNLEATA